MAVKIYNSQSQQKEVFEPLEPGKVKMYVCGPTVYDFLHVGNFRGAVFFNLVRNWLEKRGFEVTYVYNYTDVDDKILNRAEKEGVSPQEISETYIAEFQKDYQSLKLRPHSHNPRVTEHMTQIIDFVKELVAKGHAYAVDGDVYYHVPSFKDYGKLSHKKLEDLEAGFRIEVDERKKHSADFALWKKAKTETELGWDSPWGRGRPGWHIECSAMSRSLLGDSIDIHGGGMDLIFPHHENEIAQSEGCTGQLFVKYWMHNNMIQFGDQKMSKSLGNVVTGRAFLEKYNGEILKYLMLSAHYRSPTDLSEAQVHRSVAALARIYSALAWAQKLIQGEGALVPVPPAFQKAIDEAEEGFAQALDDDFNTPEALARLFEVVRQFNQMCRTPGKVKPEQKAVAEVFFHWLTDKGQVMALFGEPPVEFLNLLDDMLLQQKGLERQQVDLLVQERTQARASKDYSRSDELRSQLEQMGISVQDTPEGSLWEVAK